MKKNKSLSQFFANAIQKPFHKRILMLLLTCLFLRSFVVAQTADSLQLFRDFIALSNSYKKIPLQMSMEFRQLSNFPLPEKDKATIDGEFYIKNEGAYIIFGGVEQVVNDSLALVVINDIKQMTLSPNSTTVAGLLNAMIAQPVQDLSALKFAAVYTVKMNKITGRTNEIAIASRNMLEGSDLPLVGISVFYNSALKLPEKLITVRRSLIKIPGNDSRDTATRNALQSVPGKRVAIAGRGDFIVKEEQAEIIYKSISHAENMPLPVTITDRIVKVGLKNFEPVKAYQAYHLSQDTE